MNDKIYPTMVIRSQTEAIKLQEKEIERLNEELNCYKFPSCKSDDIEVVRLNLVDMMRKNKRLEQEKEILNKRAKKCEKAYLRTRHQYSELENKYLTDEYIIKELEKWLCEEQVIYRDYLITTPTFDSDYGANHLTLSNLTKVLDKLQELKGDSSNE